MLQKAHTISEQVTMNKLMQGGESSSQRLLAESLVRLKYPSLSESDIQEMASKTEFTVTMIGKDENDDYPSSCASVSRVKFEVPLRTTLGEMLGLSSSSGDDGGRLEPPDDVTAVALSEEDSSVKSFPSAPFSYTSLSSASREIRLLHFAGITKEGGLCLTMQSYALDEVPPFNAVSYCWGDGAATSEAICNGKPLTVTLSLDYALKRILSWKRNVALWADGICINQNDMQERASQVKLMGDIYSAAEATLAYIGEPLAQDEEHKTEISLDHGAFALIQQVNAIWRDTPADDLHPRPSTEWGDLQIPDANTEQGLIWWLPLLHLCSQPWYSRSWVFQEVVLAKEVYLLYGTAVSSLESVTRFWDLASRRDPPPALREGPIAAWKDGIENWNQLGLFGEMRRTRGRMQNEDDATELFQPGNFGYVLHRWQQFPQSLLGLLIKNRAADATDHRDKVYCLLSLANDIERLSIEPNYSPTNSAARLYQDIAEKYIQEGFYFQILHQAGMPQRLGGLPSWVPDWSTKSRHPLDTALYCCTKNTAPSPRFLHDGLLRLRGAFLDGILMLQLKVQFQYDEPLNLHDSLNGSKPWFLEDDPMLPRLPGVPDRNNAFGAIVSHAEMSSLTLLSANSSEYEIREAVWRTLIANKGWMSSDPKSERFAYEAWRKSRPDPFDNEWWPPQSLDASTMEAVWPFQARVLHATQGYRFGLTICGSMGLFPKDCQMGDLIVIFPGARTPFVVRQGRLGSYTLVGDCYIHGMMEGEMLKPSRRGEVQDAGYPSRTYDIRLRPWVARSTEKARNHFRPYFNPDKQVTATVQDIDLL